MDWFEELNALDQDEFLMQMFTEQVAAEEAEHDKYTNEWEARTDEC